MENPNISPERISTLKEKCIKVRKGILEQTYFGGSSHIGGSLSCVEILTALYFQLMEVDPHKPDLPSRDRFVMSKGHGASALYSVLAERGYFPVEELRTFMKDDTRLQKHLDMHKLPGIDVSSGSLGQGLSIAVGMALADRMDKKDRYVYCLIGDGESQEGQIWEAALAAAHYKLERLIAVLDRNYLQVDDYIKKIISIEPVFEKWESFGWHVQDIDGHDTGEIIDAVDSAKQTPSQPHMIIARTVKGKGVSFIENQPAWHSHGLDQKQFELAMKELGLSSSKEVG